MQNLSPPIVLVFAGHDPSGGAGLTADTQTLAQLHCHIAPIVTSITVQDTVNVVENKPLPASQIAEQAQIVLNDIIISACKIGLLGDVEIIKTIAKILQTYSHFPTIIDPVLAAGGGQHLSDYSFRKAMITHLMPYTFILTPNSEEARKLTGQKNLDKAAKQLMKWGCQYVCITGTHEETNNVMNVLYGEGERLESWTWPRLPHQYHGSGCTFASSLTAYLARGMHIKDATYSAQHYTWLSLKRGFKAGHGQLLPFRLKQIS